jgi:hypothetical protein
MLRLCTVNEFTITYAIRPVLVTGKAADIEEFQSLVTREKGDNNKNRHGDAVISSTIALPYLRYENKQHLN